MIKCNERDKKAILDYIDEDYGKCAYLYIDLIKYGFDNNNVSVWKQINEEGNNCLIALQYYNGMHIYSRDNCFDSKDLVKLIKYTKPALVCGMKYTLDLFSDNLKEDYDSEFGKVLRLGKYTGVANDGVRRATREEIRLITDLLMTDDEMGGPYTSELLYNQLLERFDTKFGRNWIRTDDKGIISHCATYAELDNIAVISGGIVRKDHRGKGEYPGQLGAMCRDLYNERKEVISYYYGGAKTAHKLVGFDILGDWEKLIRKK